MRKGTTLTRTLCCGSFRVSHGEGRGLRGDLAYSTQRCGTYMDKRRHGHTYAQILCAISIQTYTARTVLPDLDVTGSHATLDRSMKGAKLVEASREPPSPSYTPGPQTSGTKGERRRGGMEASSLSLSCRHGFHGCHGLWSPVTSWRPPTSQCLPVASSIVRAIPRRRLLVGSCAVLIWTRIAPMAAGGCIVREAGLGNRTCATKSCGKQKRPRSR